MRLVDLDEVITIIKQDRVNDLIDDLMAGVHIILRSTAPAQDFTLKMLMTQAECDMHNQIKQTHNLLDEVCIDCLRDLVQQPMSAIGSAIERI